MPADEVCYWCKRQCGGKCLGLTQSTQMKTNDPAYWMLENSTVSTKTVHRAGCYICEDPEYAQMGLPLCNFCPKCSEEKGESAGHVPADDEQCDDCGYNLKEHYQNAQT